MIAVLHGKVIENDGKNIILDVHGVGYELQVTSSTIGMIQQSGPEACIHTHLHFRDDTISLYGFSSSFEKEIFQKIITVSGAGPKTALAILSALSPHDFVRAIQQENRTELTKISGIGKKTAERLILELKDSLPRSEEDSSWDLTEELPVVVGGVLQDVFDALIALGYSASEAEHMAKAAHAQLGETQDLQLLLKTALASGGK